MAGRALITAAALVIWFWTQSLIGSRGAPVSGIGDRLQAATASMNGYLHVHASSADALLITSSAVIDLLALFLLGKWLFAGVARPFLALLIVLGLRQIMQAVVSLPVPDGIIWRYPGFPSLLVTYGISNDFFFSAHTAIAVLGALEFSRGRNRWFILIGLLIVLFEVSTVVVLRAHYSMDIFTGAVAALYAAYLAERVSGFFQSFRLQELKT